MAGKGRKEKIIDGDFKIIKQIEALGPQDKYTPKATQDKYDYLIGQLRKGMPEMKMGGKVQKMKYGGKAAPVAKVKVERLKKMRDPYGESNFASETSNGKDAYTQRVIAAMKGSGQPFMDGGKVKKMNYGGKVKKMNYGGVVPGRGGSFKGMK